MERTTITVDGRSYEAVREHTGAPWLVTMPDGDVKEFHGSKLRLRAKLKEWAAPVALALILAFTGYYGLTGLEHRYALEDRI